MRAIHLLRSFFLSAITLGVISFSSTAVAVQDEEMGKEIDSILSVFSATCSAIYPKPENGLSGCADRAVIGIDKNFPWSKNEPIENSSEFKDLSDLLERQLNLTQEYRALLRILARFVFACGNTQNISACADRFRHAIVSGGFDPHSTYWNDKELEQFQKRNAGTLDGVGLQFQKKGDGAQAAFVVVKPIKGGPAEQAGIRFGDVITHVDGEAVSGLSANDVAAKIMGKRGTKVTLTIERSGAPLPPITLVRAAIKVPQVEGRLVSLDGKTYAVTALFGFGERAAQDLQQEFKRLKRLADGAGTALAGVILDLRDNGGGLLDEAQRVVELFLDAPEGITVEYSRTGNLIRAPHGTYPGDMTGGLLLVVLVNGGSASASEVVAGSLYAKGRAVIAGERTFGKGSVQTILVLPPSVGGALKITTSEYRLIGKTVDDSHMVIQCNGVPIDIPFLSAFDVLPEKRNERPRECDLENSIRPGGSTGDSANTAPKRPLDGARHRTARKMLEAFEADIIRSANHR